MPVALQPLHTNGTSVVVIFELIVEQTVQNIIPSLLLCIKGKIQLVSVLNDLFFSQITGVETKA